MEIPHPSKSLGESIYGATKVFPDDQAEPGETYLGMVHGIVHELSVSFVAVLLALRAQRKGFESALYFFGIGALNCLATRGFPDIGSEIFRACATRTTSPGLGWLRGSRLVVADHAGAARGRVGAALVRSACVAAIDAGALRFDAHVQDDHAHFFARLGWERVRPPHGELAGHGLMRWPVDRFEALVRATKSELGPLLAGLLASRDGWLGDDGVPVPGSAMVAATDVIMPSMVERDPEWAGWCGCSSPPTTSARWEPGRSARWT